MTREELLKALADELKKPEFIPQLPLLLDKAVNAVWSDVFGDWLLRTVQVQLQDGVSTYSVPELSSLLRLKQLACEGGLRPAVVPLSLLKVLEVNEVLCPVAYVAVDTSGKEVRVLAAPTEAESGLNLWLTGEFKDEEKLLEEAWELVKLKALSYVADERNPVWLRDYERVLRAKRSLWARTRNTGFVRAYERRWL